MNLKIFCSRRSPLSTSLSPLGIFRFVDVYKRQLLTLAYDGTNYCGFQVQPNGRSVAQTLSLIHI